MIRMFKGALLLTAMFVGAANSAMAGDASQSILDRSVMGVRSGMTLQQARQAALSATWRYEHRFMVDFSALCAFKGPQKDAETLFCAITPEREKERGADKIEAIVVLSPALQTAEGAHVGMSVSAASKIYGAPELSFHPENESREYLDFAKAPKWMNFQASSEKKTDGFVGVYAATNPGSGYHQTSHFAEDAIISRIWLY